MQLELIRWVGVGLFLFALFLAMVDLSQQSDEGPFMMLLAGASVVFLAGLGYVAPDVLLSISFVFNIGSWFFYAVAIVASVYFASRMLVIG